MLLGSYALCFTVKQPASRRLPSTCILLLIILIGTLQVQSVRSSSSRTTDSTVVHLFGAVLRTINTVEAVQVELLL